MAVEKEKKDIGTELFFSDAGNSMTIYEFDEAENMSIVVRSDGRKAIYELTIWETKQLKKFITDHLKTKK